jgi:hypothetical protein
MVDFIQNQISLYISTAPALQRERDALGRSVTAIPTTLRWQIVHTPQPRQPLDFKAVAGADVHVLVLGSDIQAPVGLEWQIARRAGRSPILFKRDTLHTPAADAFIRALSEEARWLTYTDEQQLGRQVQAWLGEYLLVHAGRFALNAAEIEQLRSWQRERSQTVTQPADREHSAGDSGVIFSRERYEPTEGTLVR